VKIGVVYVIIAKQKPVSRTGANTLEVRVLPFHVITSPSDPIATRTWWLVNFGCGEVDVFGNHPGLSPTFFCRLQPAEGANFVAGGIILRSVDHLGATIRIALA
jgi:hypothetical protein